MIGVDGCRGGWVAVIGDDGQHLECHTAAEFEQLLEVFPDDMIAVDVPIGLLDEARRGGREPDIAARGFVTGFASSVFSPPVRATLPHADDYQVALEASRASSSACIGLSRQAHALIPRIAEVDAVMTPELQQRVREVHPELSFLEMNSGPLCHRKRTGAGFFERLNLLEREEVAVPPLDTDAADLRFAADDLLDAMAAWWTARRISRGEAIPVPSEPERDSEGLLMQIWR